MSDIEAEVMHPDIAYLRARIKELMLDGGTPRSELVEVALKDARRALRQALLAEKPVIDGEGAYLPKIKADTFEPLEIHKLGEGDLYRFTDEEQAVLRTNMDKACSQCPGFCCMAFSLPWWEKTPEEVQARIDKLEAAPTDTPGREDALYALKFFQHRLIPIRMKDDRDGTAQQIYSCKEFDWKKKRCSVYQDRPQLCRRYHCGPSLLGETPTDSPGQELVAARAANLKIIKKAVRAAARAARKES